MLKEEHARRNFLFLYALVALGCVAVLMGAPDVTVSISAIPGAAYALKLIAQFTRDQWDFAKSFVDAL